MAKHYRNNHSSSKRSRENSGGSKSIAWIIVGIVVGIGMASFLFTKFQPHSATKLISEIHAPTHTKHELASSKTDLPVVGAAPLPVNHKPQFDFYTMLSSEQAQLNQGTTTSAAPPSPKPTPQADKPPVTAPTPTVAASAPVPNAQQNVAPPAQDDTDETPPVQNSANLAKKTAPPSAAHEDSLAQEAQEALNSVKKANKSAPDATVPVDIDANNAPARFFLQLAAVADDNAADRLKAELLLMGLNVTIQKTLINGQTVNHINLGPYPNRKLALKKQNQLQHHHISSILVKG